MGSYNQLLFLIGTLTLLGFCSATSTNNKTTKDRGSRLLPIFQVVNFPNDVCASTTTGRNGTCYTADECSNNGGSHSGTCAEGYGVCCVFSLGCGSTSSQNCTFLVQKSITGLPDAKCDYTICKSDSDVCRIRLDFTTFDIAQPQVGTSAAAATANSGGAVGDCITDRFSITSPGSLGTPVICGYNTGQHVYVDASAACNKVAFDISSGDSTSRSWDIKVTQYKCGHENGGGNDGCLQYHTGTSGTIASFNFRLSDATVSSAATHLSDQNYQICMRRESGYCAICYTASIQPSPAAAADNLVSFGISGANVAGLSGVDTLCVTDYITIPNGEEGAAFAVGTKVTEQFNRFCDRHLYAIKTGTVWSATTMKSVCSQTIPFNVGVFFDTIEVSTEEQDITSAGGITGFSLDYQQIKC